MGMNLNLRAFNTFAKHYTEFGVYFSNSNLK